jgi:hypothetical protein
MLVSDLLNCQSDAEQFCLRMCQAKSPTGNDEIRRFFMDELPRPAGLAFQRIFDAVVALGYDPRPGEYRDGVSFQLVPKALLGKTKTESLNLYCFNRGRYIRPTLWWSVSAMVGIPSLSTPIAEFRRQMAEVSPTNDITYGIHCEGECFERIVEPVIKLATAVRGSLWAD